MNTQTPYQVEIARAWAVYRRTNFAMNFYQFAVAFKAGWDARESE